MRAVWRNCMQALLRSFELCPFDLVCYACSLVDRVPKSERGLAPFKPADTAVRLVVVAGEPTPEEALHARLAPIVNRLLWTFLGADPDRDDLAHDVFIKIMRGAASVRDASRLEEWAARVTMNALKNEFRRRKLRRFLSFDPSDDAGVPRYHPDFEGRELLLRTNRILERLPVAERLPFTLRLLNQASAEDIAQACGCSVRTVKRRLKAARDRFLRLAGRDALLGPRLAKLTLLEEDADE